MNNLHLIPSDKFTEPFINFINDNFHPNEHVFLVIGKGMKINISSSGNVKKISKDFKSLVVLLREIYKSDKILLHSVFFKQIVILLALQPWLLKKCNWVIWGGDLYSYKFRNKNLKSNIYEMIKRFAIKKFEGIITYIDGEYNLAREWYGAKGKAYFTFFYPSNLYKEYDLSGIKKERNKTYIQIGNSGDPTNNHIEIFKKLMQYKDNNIEVICPLSYGDPKYIEMVIEEGERIFADKFTSIIDFMPFKKYLEVLAKVDVAIFNHQRQQAMGNITTLIGLGKKVYVRDDITTWEFLNHHELNIYNANGKLDNLLEKMPNSLIVENVEILKRNFSEAQLVKDWQHIFSS